MMRPRVVSRGGDARLNHLGSREKLLLALLLPIWAGCFGLSVRAMLWGQPAMIPSAGVRADGASPYPVVVFIAPWRKDLDRSGIELGDRLVRIGEADLRGVGALGFWARFQAETEYLEPPPVVYERAGQRGETQLPAPRLVWPPLLAASLGYVFTALFVLFRAPPSPLVKALSLAFLFLAISCANPITGGIALSYLGLALLTLTLSLGNALALRAVLLFPEGRPAASSWARIGPWASAILGPLVAASLTGFPVGLRPSGVLSQLGMLVYFAAILGVATRKYRRADALVQRQFRWLVAGIYGALAPALFATIFVLIDKLLFGQVLRFYPLLLWSSQFLVLIPLSVLFAIARYNLFDVDRLLSATASYNVVLVVLLAGALVGVPRVAEAASGLVGVTCPPKTGPRRMSLLPPREEKACVGTSTASSRSSRS